jgi:predicted aldo/keto reductase-like oxidoreductase
MASRRSFLAAALAPPAGGLATSPQTAARPKTPALRYRTLGRTGLKVTEVGFGAEAVSDVSVIRQALDLGINFFDTAHAYQGGNNERVLGAALGADRKKIILSSRSYVKDRKTLEAELDLSLRELKTDYLDIWYLGARDEPVADELLAFQEAAKKAGKFRFSGFSTHKPWALLDFIKKSHFDVVMIPYNFAMGSARDPFKMDSTRLDTVLDEFGKAGLGVVAIKVMAGGYRGPSAPKDKLEELHKRPNAYVSALRWALRSPQIHTTSISMHDRDQLEDNMQAMEAPFSGADEKTLAAHLEHIRPLYCRMCYQCDGQCPQGLPVADVLRFLMYADGYRRFELGYERFRTLPANLRAVRCEECGQCAVSCPNGVAVRERLAAAQRMFA